MLSLSLLLLAALCICAGGTGAARNHSMLEATGFALGVVFIIIWLAIGN